MDFDVVRGNSWRYGPLGSRVLLPVDQFAEVDFDDMQPALAMVKLTGRVVRTVAMMKADLTGQLLLQRRLRAR